MSSHSRTLGKCIPRLLVGIWFRPVKTVKCHTIPGSYLTTAGLDVDDAESDIPFQIGSKILVHGIVALG